jgi:carbon-monoxide dehydrogenase medium subunit
MKAPPFDFVRPGTVEAAVAALAGAAGDALVLAGGQSLVPMLNLRLAAPALVVDIGALTGLRAVREEDEAVVLGSRITHAMLEDGRLGDHWNGMLGRVARDIAYRAVRNRGTIGGSLAHADPAADWPVVLATLDADVELTGPEGARSVPCDEFVLGPFTTAREPFEIVTAVRLARLSKTARWSFIKLRRKAGAFAEALACAVLDRDRGVARVFAGGSSTGLLRADALEGALGGSVDPAVIGGFVDEAAPDLDAYHRQLHIVALKRAMTEIAS